MNKKNIVFAFMLTSFFLFSQQWEIEHIRVNVKGITQKGPIIRVSQLNEGDIYSDLEALENAITIANDNLFNERIFKTVNVNYEVISRVDDKNLLEITINVEDSWNIIALPYPKYDSNSGFSFSLKGRDYNFLGLMEPLALNINYNFDEDQNHNFNLGLSSTLNFPILEQNFSLGLNHYFYYKPADPDDVFYMHSSASLGTGFIIPWDVYDGNKIGYNLSFSISKNYSFIPLNSDSRDDLSLGFSHGLSLGQNAWGDNNFREGFTYSLSNAWSLSIDPEGDSTFDDSWNTTVSAQSAYHFDWYPLGYSGRILLNQNLKEGRSSRGSPMRGVPDSDISSHGAVYINNALYITVWNNPEIWEIMGGPCLDFGYLWDVPAGQDNFIWSLAVDGLCYPSFAKSFQARITVGLNGTGFMNSTASGLGKLSGNLELFFGLGTFF